MLVSLNALIKFPNNWYHSRGCGRGFNQSRIFIMTYGFFCGIYRFGRREIEDQKARWFRLFFLEDAGKGLSRSVSIVEGSLSAIIG